MNFQIQPPGAEFSAPFFIEKLKNDLPIPFSLRIRGWNRGGIARCQCPQPRQAGWKGTYTIAGRKRVSGISGISGIGSPVVSPKKLEVESYT